VFEDTAYITITTTTTITNKLMLMPTLMPTVPAILAQLQVA
jgi:hypothetical protein